MTLPTGRRAERRGDIQGLRAIAVLLVVLFHAGLPVPGGFIGVDVFFVISGFVITGVLLAELESPPQSFRSFYAGRARRLVPALAILILTVAVASMLLLSPLGPQQATAATGGSASLFMANLHLMRVSDAGYFDLPAETNALLHTWSLSVEVQFYVAFPTLLALGWRWSRRRSGESWRQALFTIVLAGVVASFALAWLLTSSGGSPSHTRIAFYSPATRAWEFGAGVLVALAAPRLTRLAPTLATALGLTGLALVVGSAGLIDATSVFPGAAALAPVIGAALLIGAGMASRGGAASLLAVRPAVWIGDLSYGWYLWHWPTVVFARSLWPRTDWVLVVAAAASLLPAWASRRWVEDPIRSARGLSGRRMLSLAAICVAVPAAACVGLAAVNHLERRSEPVAAYAAAVAPHGGDASDCPSASPYWRTPDVMCVDYSVTEARGRVLLVGDSNAIQFIEPLSDAAQELRYDLTAVATAGCPFADLIREASNVDGIACRRFVENTLDAVRSDPPDLVIIATSSAQMVNDANSLVDPHSGDRETARDAKARLWERGVASVLSDLKRSGAATVIIDTIPQLGDTAHDWLAADCPAIRIYRGSCGIVVDRIDVERRQAPAREAEERALVTAAWGVAADFTGDLCSPDSCTAHRDGIWLYTDATHLSVEGSETLTDRLRELISAHAR